MGLWVVFDGDRAASPVTGVAPRCRYLPAGVVRRSAPGVRAADHHHRVRAVDRATGASRQPRRLEATLRAGRGWMLPRCRRDAAADQTAHRGGVGVAGDNPACARLSALPPTHRSRAAGSRSARSCSTPLPRSGRGNGVEQPNPAPPGRPHPAMRGAGSHATQRGGVYRGTIRGAGRGVGPSAVREAGRGCTRCGAQGHPRRDPRPRHPLQTRLATSSKSGRRTTDRE